MADFVDAIVCEGKLRAVDKLKLCLDALTNCPASTIDFLEEREENLQRTSHVPNVHAGQTLPRSSLGFGVSPSPPQPGKS